MLNLALSLLLTHSALAAEPAWLSRAPDSYVYPPFHRAQPPSSLARCLSLVPVEFHDYKGRLTKGELVVNRDLVADVRKVFRRIRDLRFPVKSAIAVQEFDWSDGKSMRADNTSAYNFRRVTGGTAISFHGLGRAIDINPHCNPYISGSTVLPSGATYDPSRACAMGSEKGRLVVEAFRELGWAWGGESIPGLKDYQHFEKPGPHGRRSPFCKD